MTFKLKTTTPAEYLSSLLKNWPKGWPSKNHFVIQHNVTRKQYSEFISLIDSRVGERQLETFFDANPEVLSMAIWMFSTGHHMSWIFPKQSIRVSTSSVAGLIPDYLMAGANSDGLSWFVLELKGASENAFVKEGKKVRLSSVASKGISQLLNYIDVSARDQSHLRDGLGLSGFREPKGILLIGTDDESSDPDIMAFKSAWNRTCPSLQIKSFSSLARLLLSKVETHDKK